MEYVIIIALAVGFPFALVMYWMNARRYVRLRKSGLKMKVKFVRAVVGPSGRGTPSVAFLYFAAEPGGRELTATAMSAPGTSYVGRTAVAYVNPHNPSDYFVDLDDFG